MTQLSTACQKPAYGTAKLAKNAKMTKRSSRGKDVKDQAKRRDGHRCRYPNCEMQRQGFTLHGAHIKAAGAGGNPDLSRMTLENIVSACAFHHKGTVSMHSGDIKAVPSDPVLGANGMVDWYLNDVWVGATAPKRRVEKREPAE